MCLKRWPLPEHVLGKLRVLARVVVAGVLDDALAHAEREIEPAMSRIPAFKVLHDPQRMEIVVEAEAVPAQAIVERTLAGMAERRMSDVVNQRQRLGKVLVQAKLGRDLARDLCHLNGMGQPRAEVVGGTAGEDLGLAGQPAEGARLDDPLSVALKRAPPRAAGAARGPRS